MNSELSSAQHRIALFGLFVGYALLCWWAFTPMMRALHGHWTTANDLDAGYLLLAVVFYLFWHLANEHKETGPALWLQNNEAAVRMVALAGFVVCIAAASLAAITATKSVTLALLVAGFAPLCVWVTGVRMLSGALHACAILLMATPIWSVFVPQLQALTASAVNWLLSRGNWPIYIEENLIALPQGMLEIAAGCAGLKFLQTAIALTLIEGFIARRSWRAMATIGMVCMALAIVSNWLRVSVITLLALEFGLSHPWVADHNWVGWLLFALIFGPLFYWLGRVELFARTTQTGASKVVGLVQTATRAVAAVAIAFGGAYALANAAEGKVSARIGHAQLAAVRKFCAPVSVPTEQPLAATAAHFPGAELVVDCVTYGGRRLSLRGYLRELQAQEIINPVNELVPGLGLLEYRVISQQRITNASGPALLGTQEGAEIAFGFYATGAWSGNARNFKMRSLLRPFIPGPVYALILVEPAGSAERATAALTNEFVAVAEALRIAQ